MLNDCYTETIAIVFFNGLKVKTSVENIRKCLEIFNPLTMKHIMSADTGELYVWSDIDDDTIHMSIYMLSYLASGF